MSWQHTVKIPQYTKVFPLVIDRNQYFDRNRDQNCLNFKKKMLMTEYFPLENQVEKLSKKTP